MEVEHEITDIFTIDLDSHWWNSGINAISSK